MRNLIQTSGLATLAVLLLVGCSAQPGASAPEPAASSAQPGASAPESAASPVAQPSVKLTSPTLAIDQSIAPVSASKPGDEAARVLGKCNIGEQILLEKVTGMGKLPATSELTRYVPLTGREPQLKEAGAAWIVTIHADLRQPGSTELWTDPTCVVTENEAGYYATGPVTDLTTGKTTLPEKPVAPPEFRVPPLAP